jgi:hypothetical protein
VVFPKSWMTGGFADGTRQPRSSTAVVVLVCAPGRECTLSDHALAHAFRDFDWTAWERLDSLPVKAAAQPHGGA